MQLAYLYAYQHCFVADRELGNMVGHSSHCLGGLTVAIRSDIVAIAPLCSRAVYLLRLEQNAGLNAAPARRVRSQQGFQQEGGFYRPCGPQRCSHKL